MPRKAAAVRVKSKLDRMQRKGTTSMTRSTARKRAPFVRPENKCAEKGHQLVTLAQSPKMKVVYCARLCGYYQAVGTNG
jgi:hypothetical protein